MYRLLSNTVYTHQFGVLSGDQLEKGTDQSIRLRQNVYKQLIQCLRTFRLTLIFSCVDGLVQPLLLLHAHT